MLIARRLSAALSGPLGAVSMIGTIELRPLQKSDAHVIALAFQTLGWNKPSSQYERYMSEQDRGERIVVVASSGERFAGYVTLVWRSDYEPLRSEGVPEIQDLNVLPEFRRNGIGSLLLDKVEGIASTRRTCVGIGVGLHPGYNAAQRLYVKRGYVPDGLGVTYRNEFIREGAVIVADDDLVLHFKKKLSVPTASG
jgi:ribosomal protein S18 acetylase RimI-like enzyme